MATPIILSTGSISGPGSPGEGREDLVDGETVYLSDIEVLNLGASYAWEFLDAPIDSTAVLLNPTTPTPSFVAGPTAAPGSYHVKCTVNSTDISTVILAVPLPYTGSRIPAFNEKTEYNGAGNTKGWHAAMTQFMRIVDAYVSATGSDEKVKVSATDTTAEFLFAKLVAGAGIAITKVGSGAEDVQIAATAGSLEATFIANCLASDPIGGCVYNTGPEVGGLAQVTIADNSDPATFPVVGMIIAKASATECTVLRYGETLLIATTPGDRYWVGAGGLPTNVLPVPPPGGGIMCQVVGVAIGNQRLIVDIDHTLVWRVG